jgi:hypothetical protein
MGFYKRTHHRFVLPHEELLVQGPLVQQWDTKLGFVVNEGAVLAVRTFKRVIEMLAVPCFKSFVVVHLFHNVMGVHATVGLTTEFTFLGREGCGPTSIVLGVIERTLLGIMR